MGALRETRERSHRRAGYEALEIKTQNLQQSTHRTTKKQQHPQITKNEGVLWAQTRTVDVEAASGAVAGVAYTHNISTHAALLSRCVYQQGSFRTEVQHQGR